MKLTIDAEELRSWNACSSGIKSFVAAHGETTISLEKSLESNTVKDFLYVLIRNKKHFSDVLLLMLGNKSKSGSVKN